MNKHFRKVHLLLVPLFFTNLKTVLLAVKQNIKTLTKLSFLCYLHKGLGYFPFVCATQEWCKYLSICVVTSGWQNRHASGFRKLHTHTKIIMFEMLCNYILQFWLFNLQEQQKWLVTRLLNRKLYWTPTTAETRFSSTRESSSRTPPLAIPYPSPSPTCLY